MDNIDYIKSKIANLNTERVKLVEQRKRFIRGGDKYNNITKKITHVDEKLGYFRGMVNRYDEDQRKLKINGLIGE